MKLILTSILLAFMGCGSSEKLSSKARELELYQRKPQKCSVVGKVVGVHKAGSMELARNHAMNLAAKLDASGLFIDQEVRNGKEMKVYGTAYLCE